MDINETLKQTCGEIYLRAMGADAASATEIIGKCQSILDNGEVVRLFPWQASAEDLMLADARKGLERIVLADWFHQYSPDEMQTMCRLLERGPDGEHTAITIIEGLSLQAAEIVRRYNDFRGADIRLVDPDIG